MGQWSRLLRTGSDLPWTCVYVEVAVRSWKTAGVGVGRWRRLAELKSKVDEGWLNEWVVIEVDGRVGLGSKNSTRFE